MINRRYGWKICERCGKKYLRNTPNQKYCGSDRRKEGCSYIKIKELWARNKKRWVSKNRKRHNKTQRKYDRKKKVTYQVIKK